MNSPLNNILNNQTAPLTQEELANYLSGDLSPQEMHLIESKMNADELNMEALEGFAEHPSALNDLVKLKQTFNSRVLKQRWYHSNTNLLSVSVIVLALVGSSYFFLADNSTTAEQSSFVESVSSKSTVTTIAEEDENSPNKQSAIIAASVRSKELSEKQSDALYTDESVLKKSHPIPKKEQLTYNRILHDQPQAIELEIAEIPDEIAVEEPSSPIEYIELIEAESKKEVIDIEAKELNVQKTNVKLKYLYRLKVVDYSQFYNKPLYLEDFVDTIDLESIPDKSVEYTIIGKNDSKLYVPYEDFLSQGMKMFRKNKFKNALKNFNDILLVYPDDVNAHFYGGICLYNIGRAEDAITHFDKVIKSYILAFNDEAYWYKAICLDKAHRDDEAKVVLRQIIKANSFSADKAKERLKKLENQ